MSNSLKRFSIGGVTTNLEYNLVPYLIVEITKFLDIKMLDNHIGWLVPSITNASIFFKMIGYNEASDIIYDPIRKINILFIIKESQTIELIEPTTKDSIVYTYLKTRVLDHTIYVFLKKIMKRLSKSYRI
ncbi:hypothetical protein [Anaerobiospirillum thomasii]|uniref:Uncharacterized protein n=1 Tax=Anaerobiospirillum thomasii TaxID=179995 RepID=A0A2X0XIS1_9GAMM|nr:hypothetical protein [Anaerobiospirillum thomasii]SPT78792.1 Uncharacterised protein [Anaerobiospirillum thomasii]